MSGLTFEKPLAIVDVETTGSSPQGSRILELAIIRIEEGKIVDSLNTVVDPETHIPPSITSLTGIREADIQNAPTFYDIAYKADELLSGAIFVAHNAQFDYAFIKSEFKRLGKSFSAKRLCTVSLSRKLFPKYKRHDLSSIINRCDFQCESRHRAYDDAKVLIDFLHFSHTAVGEEKYREVTEKILSRNSVPSAVPQTVVDNLPESPGVYIFYGESGEKLYIGKSINIRKRVMSHFTGQGTNKSVKLGQQVRDIEAIQTHGELGALLLESQLVKQEQPLYNRLLRHARKLIAAEEYIDTKGYKRVKLSECIIETENDEVPEGKTSQKDSYRDMYSEKTLGIFKSVSQAKKILQAYAEEYNLCQVLLGLEKTKTCFASQLGKCNSACASREMPEIYNAKFDMAFADRRVKAWPYSGQVLIEEKSQEPGAIAGTVFIVDNWKLMKSFVYDEEGNEQEFLDNHNKAFDHDAYKILVRYMLEHPRKIKNFNREMI